MARRGGLAATLAKGILAEKQGARTRSGKVAAAVHNAVREMESHGPLPPNAEWDAAIQVGASVLAAAVVKQHDLPQTPEMVARVALYLAAVCKGAAIHFDIEDFARFEADAAQLGELGEAAKGQ